MKYFTFDELCKSVTAKNLNIHNVPDFLSKKNLELLVNKVLDPIREKWNAPIIVSSGYRCERLNKAVGGAWNSQHRYGQAADIRTVKDTFAENKKLFDLIKKSGIKFDQLIWEYGNDTGPDWIHISFNEKNNRNKILQAKKINGKTTYITI